MKPMSQNAKRKVLRKTRAANGLCTLCGKPLDVVYIKYSEEGKLCSSCRKVRNEKQRERVEWYKSHGICPQCGVNDIFENEGVCPECKAKNANRYEKKKEYYITYINDRRKERRANGLCADCGKPSPDKYRCPECAAKAYKRSKKKGRNTTRQDWTTDGKCAICGGEPLHPGKRICEKCYARKLNESEKREKEYASGERVRTHNEYWKRTNADMIVHARKRSRINKNKVF